MARNKVYWWDAPKGYKAILSKSNGNCTHCVFDTDPFPWDRCGWKQGDMGCRKVDRTDGVYVDFVKRAQSK